MKGYTVRAYKMTQNGQVLETLSPKNLQWWIACNDCSFKTLQQAVDFFRHAIRADIRTQVFIEGPKGGIYSHQGRKK